MPVHREHQGTVMSVRALSAIALLNLTFFSAASADVWPRWRGPTNNGVAPEGDYPLRWSATENVAWSVDLPGEGGSTPIVLEDRIILTSPKDGMNAVLCMSRDGQPMWEATIGREVPGKNRKGTGSNPSPVTNGKLVYVYYKSGDLACFDLEGNRVWHHNLQQMYGPDTLWWDLGTSPVLTDKHVVVAVMQSREGATGAGPGLPERRMSSPSSSSPARSPGRWIASSERRSKPGTAIRLRSSSIVTAGKRSSSSAPTTSPATTPRTARSCGASAG
jgi:hypothetical protein